MTSVLRWVVTLTLTRYNVGNGQNLNKCLFKGMDTTFIQKALYPNSLISQAQHNKKTLWLMQLSVGWIFLSVVVLWSSSLQQGFLLHDGSRALLSLSSRVVPVSAGSHYLSEVRGWVWAPDCGETTRMWLRSVKEWNSFDSWPTSLWIPSDLPGWGLFVLRRRCQCGTGVRLLSVISQPKHVLLFILLPGFSVLYV